MDTGIPGATLFPQFINEYQHDWLVKKIDSQPWSDSLKRRVQQYGWRYRYDRSEMTRERDYLGILPEWLERLSFRLRPFQQCLIDQIIGNDYQPGQKIGRHIDHMRYFGDKIISLSLLGDGVLVFRNAGEVVEVPVKSRDLLVMSGEARYKWSHELKPVKSRRVSVTFRQVIV